MIVPIVTHCEPDPRLRGHARVESCIALKPEPTLVRDFYFCNSPYRASYPRRLWGPASITVSPTASVSSSGCWAFGHTYIVNDPVHGIAAEGFASPLSQVQDVGRFVCM